MRPRPEAILAAALVVVCLVPSSSAEPPSGRADPAPPDTVPPPPPVGHLSPFDLGDLLRSPFTVDGQPLGVSLYGPALYDPALRPYFGAQPTAAGLIALATAVTSADPDCRSIEVRGWYRMGRATRTTFRVCYRAPNQFSLLLREGEAGPPVFYVADRKLMFYDPIRSVVLLAPKASGHFVIKATDEGLKTVWSYHWNTKRPDDLLLDFRSMLRASAGTGEKDEVVKLAASRYRLTRSWEGNCMSFAYDIDLTRTPPYTGLHFTDTRTGEVYLAVDQVVVNGPIADEAFEFPDARRLAQRVPVWELSNGNFIENLFGFAMMQRAMYARFVPADAGFLSRVVISRLIGINWDSIRRRDTTLRATFREFFPPAANHSD